MLHMYNYLCKLFVWKCLSIESCICVIDIYKYMCVVIYTCYEHTNICATHMYMLYTQTYIHVMYENTYVCYLHKYIYVSCIQISVHILRTVIIYQIMYICNNCVLNMCVWSYTHVMYIQISVQHICTCCIHKHTFILCTKTHMYVMYTNIYMFRAYKYLCIFFVQWSSIKSCIYAIIVY